MYQQMDIFDFIEKPPGCVPPERDPPPYRTQFEQLFEKVRDPVLHYSGETVCDAQEGCGGYGRDV